MVTFEFGDFEFTADCAPDDPRLPATKAMCLARTQAAENRARKAAEAQRTQETA